MERRTLMSNVQLAPLSYEDLANQVLLLVGNFLAIELWKGVALGYGLLKKFSRSSFGTKYCWAFMWRREKALITASRSPLTWLWVERYLSMNLFHAILVQYSLSKQTWLEWQIKQAPRRVRVYADGIYDLFHQVPFSTYNITCDFQYVWNS